MKKFNFKPLNLLYNIMVMAVLFFLVGINVLFALPVGFIAGFVLGYFRAPAVALFMALQKEIWEADIEGNLYADNQFLKTFKAADKANINGRTVTIPQAGQGGDVQKNRTELPATVKTRNDQPTSYEIAEFTSDPMRVSHADTVELSYDKRNDVMEDERKKLAEFVAEDVLLSAVNPGTGTTTKLPASSILLTDGAAVAASAPDSTGTRKAYRLNDFQRARSFFIRQKSWVENSMFALITAEAEAQMFPAESAITATYMATVTEAERRAGVMYKAYGFKIMTRSSVYVLDNAGNFKPSAAEGAATDDEGVLFYNGSAIEFALGDIQVFDNEGRAEYYSDIFSFLVRAGGRARREKMEGILVVKQAKAA